MYQSYLSVVLTHLSSNCGTEGFANTFDRDSIEDLLEESGDDHPDCLRSSESPRLRVEDQFFIDATAGAAVSASYIVGVDL